MICPLYKTTLLLEMALTDSLSDEIAEKLMVCDEEQCEWWDYKNNCCALLAISQGALLQ